MLLALPLLAVAAGACGGPPAPDSGPSPQGATLHAFRSEAELMDYHETLVAAIRSKPPLGSTAAYTPTPVPPPPGDSAAEPAPDPAPAAVEPRRPNVGGDPVVRAVGEHLLVLREGRLSTVHIGGGALEPVETVDALGPGAQMDGTYFHDLLVSGSDVYVLGLRGGAPAENHVAWFRLDASGRLEHRGTAVLRSAESPYAQKHAARLAGGKLVFYNRLEVAAGEMELDALLPAMRGADGAFAVLAAPQRVYRPVFPAMGWMNTPVLHSVTVCDPVGPQMACTATALYAPNPLGVHVSPTAVYLWTEQADPRDQGYRPERKFLLRMPLDGSAPTAARVDGSPYSAAYLERDGYLNVSLLHDGWTEESRSHPPSLALLRLPLSAFGDGRGGLVQAHYRRLPRFPGRHYSTFVGDWLLYANRLHDDYMVQSGLVSQASLEGLGMGSLRWADTAVNMWHPLRSPTHALQPLADDAALSLLGTGGDSLQVVLLLPGNPVRAAGIWRRGVMHHEGRMPGVVHAPDGPIAGRIGMPMGMRLTEHSWRATGAVFLRYDGTGIRALGELMPSAELAGSRDVVPFFADGRIFALLGGELVEAVEEGGGLREVRRVRLP
ncbi:MAG TPA: hypothetical protein VHG08_17330 [Longimicrobium sp.]|nr:hypothetical protein [Longimicrobium sp.]